MSISIDYTSRDFDSLKQSLMDYAEVAFPQWVPASEGDFGVLMLELLAYVGDINSYYVDRAQNEAYLPTATQASSVLQIAQMLGYVPGTGSPATGFVWLEAAENRATTTGAGSPPFIVVPAGTQLASDYVAAIDGQVIFETDVEKDVVPGTPVKVTVTEGQTQKDPVTGAPIKIDESTGLPDQTYKIPKPRVYVDTVQVFVAGTAWRKVDHLLDADPNDQVFETFTDSTGYTWIRFGDGINGAIPAVGLAVSSIYRTGYGAAGNLSEGRVMTVYSNVPGISVQRSTSVSGKSSSSLMTGGADPESTEQIRANAPKAFFTQQRAVTVDDFTNLAVAVPGVAKANAVADFFSSVTVFIVGPDGGKPTVTLKDKVSGVLQSKSLAGVTVSVEDPASVAVNLTVAVEVWPTYNRLAVEYQVRQALNTRLAFTNVDLGGKLSASDVYKAVMDVSGVRYAAVSVMARVGSVQSGTADIVFQPMEYPVAGTITVTSTGGIG